MELTSGDEIHVKNGSSTIIWTVSKVDGRLLKYFDENQHYNQIPLTQIKQLIDSKQATIKKIYKN